MDCLLMMWEKRFADYRHDVCQVLKKNYCCFGLEKPGCYTFITWFIIIQVHPSHKQNQGINMVWFPFQLQNAFKGLTTSQFCTYNHFISFSHNFFNHICKNQDINIHMNSVLAQACSKTLTRSQFKHFITSICILFSPLQSGRPSL
jgi:hypothetical protein